MSQCAIVFATVFGRRLSRRRPSGERTRAARSTSTRTGSSRGGLRRVDRVGDSESPAVSGSDRKKEPRTEGKQASSLLLRVDRRGTRRSSNGAPAGRDAVLDEQREIQELRIGVAESRLAPRPPPCPRSRTWLTTSTTRTCGHARRQGASVDAPGCSMRAASRRRARRPSRAPLRAQPEHPRSNE